MEQILLYKLNYEEKYEENAASSRQRNLLLRCYIYIPNGSWNLTIYIPEEL